MNWVNYIVVFHLSKFNLRWESFMLNLALRICEIGKITTEHISNREIFSSSVDYFKMSKLGEDHLSFILTWGEITFKCEKKKKRIVISEECNGEFGTNNEKLIDLEGKNDSTEFSVIGGKFLFLSIEYARVE